MENTAGKKVNWVQRVVATLLFVVIGAAIIIIFDPWGSKTLLPEKVDYLAKIATSLFLLGCALLAKRSEKTRPYWQILFALFILCVTVSLQWIFGLHLGGELGLRGNSPLNIALVKLNEWFVVWSVIILFTLLSGETPASIYIQKGNLKQGLLIGGIAFLVAAAGAIPMSGLMFQAKDLTLARVLPWMPWILIFVLANAALEELMFRGLFLRKLEPFLGRFLSNLVIAVVFTLIHLGVSYTPGQYVFLAVVFPLALLWGWITQKTNSLWGAILFHAGMDIPIILGIFSNL